MRKALLASAAIIILAAPSYGAEKATLTDSPDQHIRVVPYSPTKRTTVTGIVGQPTTFSFPADEKIFGIAQSRALKPDGSFADADWHQPEPPKGEDGKPVDMGNNLSLWPVAPGTTMMTVITKSSRDGTQKPYAFKLIAKPEPSATRAGAGMSLVKSANAADSIDDPDATFNLIFQGGSRPASAEKPPHVSGEAATGDRPRPAKTRRANASAHDANEDELAQDRLRTDSFNASGCHYTPKGQRGPISPLCPLDNGQWTLIRFPGLSPKPAVYITDPTHLCGVENGRYERLPRQHGAGDRVVVEEIAPRFCLRLGNENVLQLDNVNYDPAGAPTNSGTIAVSVNRQILREQPGK